MAEKARTGCLVLFALPFVLASVILGVHRRRQIGELEPVARHAPWSGTSEGPVFVEGTLVLPGERLWSYTGSQGGPRTASVVCTRTSVPRGEPMLRVDGAHSLSLRAMLPYVDYWGPPNRVMPDQLPEPLPEECRWNDQVAYVLNSISDGAHLRVLACQHQGVLVPCNDALDIVTERPLHDARDALRPTFPPVVFVAFWFSILAVVFSLALLSMLPSVASRGRAR